MPFFSASRMVPPAVRDWLALVPWPTRPAASCSTFFSSADRLSQNFLLMTTDCGLYWWLVRVMYFCTSLSLAPWMVATGFSWPSTAPCSSAAYSSGKGSGVGLAPSA
jgi:hypothetical protein